ncbi:MAG TPA: ribonuclease P protein component [Chloroflexi bacterium]|nr:ribonuclease P protein component [Chloroflexota bacterium]
MKQKFRLRSSIDFKRVRRSGKSYAHPLIVLIKQANEIETSRFGISAGRSMGNAVQRNRAKRRIREVIRPRISEIQSGWDLIFLARAPLKNASYSELQTAIDQLIKRAGISKEQNVN